MIVPLQRGESKRIFTNGIEAKNIWTLSCKTASSTKTSLHPNIERFHSSDWITETKESI